MENNIFKGSLFGGFNRQDVMNYIEKASRESAVLLQEKDAQISALEQQVRQLSAQQKALQEELQQTKQSCEQANDALATAHENWLSTQAALQEAQARSQQDAQELQRLSAAAEALQAEVEEYHTLKNNIAEVEVDAKHRAATIVAEAEKEARTLVQKAREQAENILQEAGAQAEKTRSEANAAAAAVRQRADQHAVLTRQQLNALLSSCRAQYEALMETYKASALQAATGLQKAQENLARLPGVFDKMNEGLRKLGENKQKKD